MDENTLAFYWNTIPVGANNAVDYPTLCSLWKCSERYVRRILHRLSCHDNGDDFILVRSAKGRGFYKTDDPEQIEAYRAECLNRGKSILAALKKINRIQGICPEQSMMEDLEKWLETMG